MGTVIALLLCRGSWPPRNSETHLAVITRTLTAEMRPPSPATAGPLEGLAGLQTPSPGQATCLAKEAFLHQQAHH